MFEEEKGKIFFAEVGKRATINAVNENKALGIPVTFLKDGKILTKQPDGEIVVEGELTNVPARRLKKGTVLHVK